MNDLQIEIEIFIKESFINTADNDYIAARECYRRELYLQYLWAAEQAIEKYLKGILLYSRINVKPYSHKLNKLLTAIRAISGFDFIISNDVENYINYVENQGMNRYLEKYHFIDLGDLEILDKTVWEIRRYCQQLRPGITQTTGTNIPPLDTNKINRLNNALVNDNRSGVVIRGGVLEKLIKGKNSLKRSSLIWHNLYYGKVQKRKLRNRKLTDRFEKPVHHDNPNLVNELRNLVKL